MRNVTRKLGVALGALVVSATAAQAQVTFTGSTRGCFGAGCTGTNTATFQGLTFNTSSFTTTTDVNGLAPVGGTNNNFGTLTLLSTPSFNYSGTVFNLFMDFTAPGTASSSFTSVISGNVVATNNGIVVFFNPATNNNVNFSNGTRANVTISNPIGVNADNPAQQISGVIQAVSTVPEPSTYALLATGIAGLGMVARRRRTNV